MQLSLEFEYLNRKSRCEMLIGEDDISSDVITLFKCLPSRLFLLRSDWQKSDGSLDREP